MLGPHFHEVTARWLRQKGMRVIGLAQARLFKAEYHQ